MFLSHFIVISCTGNPPFSQVEEVGVRECVREGVGVRECVRKGVGVRECVREGVHQGGSKCGSVAERECWE